MLLRNATLGDRDPDIFHTMTSHTPTPQDTTHTHDQHQHYQTENDSNNLDDIWASDSPPTTTTTTHPHHYPPRHHEVSDIPRLSQAHHTAGYRDGIALAKARTAQQGFDEGYGLGATVGARAGQLLGVLEGLAAAVGLHSLSLSPPPSSTSSSSPSADGLQWAVRDEARRIEALLNDARRELSVRGVFDGEYWAADGNWRYEVSGSSGLGEDGAVVFADVADAHPLLRKWSGIVRAEAARYGVDWEVLKDEMGDDARREAGEEDEREREARARRERAAQPAARGREALAW